MSSRAHHLLWAQPGLIAMLLSIAIHSGCTDEDASSSEADAGQVCSGHGELHGDHCHCDPGFSPSEDERSCLPAPDAHVHDEQDAHVHDESDAEVGEAPGQGELAFSPTDVHAATGQAEDGTQVWLLEAGEGSTRLSLEIYEAFGGPVSPGVIEITETEANYATCGTCLLLRTGCTAHDDHFHCERTFMPRPEGEVHLDAMGNTTGERLTGELLDLTFLEVMIGEDLNTQAVAGGEALHLDVWAFDAPLEALGGADEECGGHGELHGDHCHCDPGYSLDPEDQTRCIPN